MTIKPDPVSFKIVFIFFFLFPFLTCSSLPAPVVTKKIESLESKTVLLCDALFFYELFPTKDTETRFNNNLFIGGIQFSGGFVKNQALGMTIQSEKRSFLKQKEFESDATKFIGILLKDAFADKKIVCRDIEKKSIKDLLAFSVVADRKIYKEDGTDNINLPRNIYTPHNIDISKLPAELKVRNADYIAVPVIEYYYGHNGGWFNGQAYGCGAGARVSIHLYIYDARTGEVALSYTNFQRIIYEFKFNMSAFDMEQHLLKIEEMLSENLKKSLFK